MLKRIPQCTVWRYSPLLKAYFFYFCSTSWNFCPDFHCGKIVNMLAYSNCACQAYCCWFGSFTVKQWPSRLLLGLNANHTHVFKSVHIISLCFATPIECGRQTLLSSLALFFLGWGKCLDIKFILCSTTFYTVG